MPISTIRQRRPLSDLNQRQLYGTKYGQMTRLNVPEPAVRNFPTQPDDCDRWKLLKIAKSLNSAPTIYDGVSNVFSFHGEVDFYLTQFWLNYSTGKPIERLNTNISMRAYNVLIRAISICCNWRI